MSRAPRKRSKRRDSYFLPLRYTRGTLAELLFWHGIYFLMASEGETVDSGGRAVVVTYEQLTGITGLSRKTIRKLLDRAITEPAPFQITVEEGVKAYTYRLILPHFDHAVCSKRAAIPYRFMTEEWISVLSAPPGGQTRGSRFPITVLNLFLKLPRGKWLTQSEIKARIKRRDQQRPPDPAQVRPALAYLLELGLLHSNAPQNSYRLNQNQLEQNAQTILDNMRSRQLPASNLDAAHQELISWGRNLDPNRAELTLNIVSRGNFHLETHFREIFHDVGKISVENDLRLLYYAIDRHRNRPSNAMRWKNCFQLFINKLDQHAVTLQSDKISIRLNEETKVDRQLKIIIPEDVKLRWGKCIIWINDHTVSPFLAQDRYSITLKLSRRLQLIWSRTVTYEYERLKVDLTGELDAGGENLLNITAETQKPLPTVSIYAYIEVSAVKNP